MIMTKLASAISAIKADVDTGYFDTVAGQIQEALEAVIPFVWIAVAVAIIGCGLLCIVGSEKSKEMAKSKFVAIVIGCGLVLGAIYIAQGISGVLTIK